MYYIWNQNSLGFYGRSMPIYYNGFVLVFLHRPKEEHY